MISDPDGFIGTILAIEGISDARVVLNGPTGCRINPLSLSNRLFPRDNPIKQRSSDEPFFFGQSRIPCTYLDRDDYIHGSTHKLKEILPQIAGKGDAILGLVNSPGASLLGDDLKRFLTDANLDDVCISFEGAAYSRPFTEGYDRAMAAVLRWLKLNNLPKTRNRVNLIGFSLIQKYWQGNVAEISHLCNLMGLVVVSVPGAGSSVAEIRESTTAAHNIVIFPEYCRKTADFYESEFGIPPICSPGGAPVGFTATEIWIRTVAVATGCDPGPALDEIRKCRVHAYNQISRSHSMGGFPRGMTFAIRGDSSFVVPLTIWLFDYLAMIPVSVDFIGEEDPVMVQQLREFLSSHMFSSNVIGADPEINEPDIYFGDELTGRGLILSEKSWKSIDILNRTFRTMDFTQKAFLGGQGALWILELIFNPEENFF